MHAEVDFELGGRARIVTRSNVLHGHISHPLSGRDNSIQVNFEFLNSRILAPTTMINTSSTMIETILRIPKAGTTTLNSLLVNYQVYPHFIYI